MCCKERTPCLLCIEYTHIQVSTWRIPTPTTHQCSQYRYELKLGVTDSTLVVHAYATDQAPPKALKVYF